MHTWAVDTLPTQRVPQKILKKSISLYYGHANGQMVTIPSCPECPICFDEMKPPTKIAQCLSGHLICLHCKERPEVNILFCSFEGNYYIILGLLLSHLQAEVYWGEGNRDGDLLERFVHRPGTGAELVNSLPVFIENLLSALNYSCYFASLVIY